MSTRHLAGTLIAVVLTASAVSGCSDDDGDLPTDSVTGLSAALSRVSLPDGGDMSVYYQNSRALNELLGGDFSMDMESPNYAQLNGMGAASLPTVMTVADDVGIDLPASDYAISVGEPPVRYALIAGGQDGAAVTDKLTAGGWTADGDRLTAPLDLEQLQGSLTQYAMALAQVMSDGGDLRFGDSEADLGLVDAGGGSLADDGRVSAIADCLGQDVLAAVIDTPELRDTTPMIGLGVRAQSADDRPEVVVCTSWDSEELAAGYADRAEHDLAEGDSVQTAQPYRELFDASATVEVDGTLASWRTGTDHATRLFDAWFQDDLPGMMRSCDRLTPEQLAAAGREGHC